MRLGFACKVLGADIPSHDARKWQSNPHLRVSIGYMRRMFDYIKTCRIDMYRISSDVAPYYTDLTRPQFGHQLEQCASELAELGQMAVRYDIRLSTHPGQYVVLNSPDPKVYQAALRDLDYHADLLDMMGLNANAKIVLHLGGVYNDRRSALSRWIDRYSKLPEKVRRRLVIENDDKSYCITDVLEAHRRTAVPVVFDVLHHKVLNPGNVPEGEALDAALQTWSHEETPKIHYSDARSEPRQIRRSGVLMDVAPLKGQHAEYLDAPSFADFLSRSRGRRNFDVMLEAKAKDLALLRLRTDLQKIGAVIPAA